MADYQTCFNPECRGCLGSRRTAGQPAGHDDAEINSPSIDIKSGSCEVDVTNDAHTLIGKSHQELLLLSEMILDFSRKYVIRSWILFPGHYCQLSFCYFQPLI